MLSYVVLLVITTENGVLKMEGTINPNKYTFEDWVKKLKANDFNLANFTNLLREAWESGYTSGFADCDYVNSVHKEMFIDDLKNDQEEHLP